MYYSYTLLPIAGWHNRLNNKAKRGPLDLYQMAPLLYAEAEFVSLQVELVSEKRLRRHQRSTYTTLQGRLSDLWNEYSNGVISTSKLLRSCAHVYAPVIPETSSDEPSDL